MFWQVLRKYFLPALIIIIVITTAGTLLYNLIKETHHPFDFSIFFNSKVKFFHSVALLSSLMGQYAIAIFYKRNKLFLNTTLKATSYFSWEFFDLFFPFITATCVYISLSVIDEHIVQEFTNIIYLLLIVLWDYVYSKLVKPSNNDLQERSFKNCTECSSDLLTTDIMVAGAFILLFLTALIGNYYYEIYVMCNKSGGDFIGEEYKAGSYNMILFFSSMLILKELLHWEKKLNPS